MEFHLGTEHYYVPMSPRLALVITLLFILITLFIVAIVLSRHTWICHNCGKRFKKKWWNCIMSSAHLHGKRFMKCPYCKKYDMCFPEDIDN